MKTVIEIAREAGWPDSLIAPVIMAKLAEFAELVRADERARMAEQPARADWWASMEALALASRPDGARFRKDRPSYAEMKRYALDQTDFFGTDESIPCYCGE